MHSEGLEIVILAGGLSRRMGADKASLQIGGKSILNHILDTARSLGRPVRIIRRDIVARCGPLGGVLTALKTSRCQQVLFLACDMPFVSPHLLRVLLSFTGPKAQAVFTSQRKKLGFPFIMGKQFLPEVEKALQSKLLSLNRFALSIHARTFECSRSFEGELFNLNRPADWRRAQRLWKRHQTRSLACQSGFATWITGILMLMTMIIPATHFGISNRPAEPEAPLPFSLPCHNQILILSLR